MKQYINATYHCQSCNAIFQAPIISDFSYGEFLLSSIPGEYRYLNALDDPIYQEVLDMILSHKSELQVDIQSIFGPLTCDTDINGYSFNIGGYNCPKCMTTKVAILSVHPNEFIYVFPVTHIYWNKLNNRQKETAYLAMVAP